MPLVLVSYYSSWSAQRSWKLQGWAHAFTCSTQLMREFPWALTCTQSQVLSISLKCFSNEHKSPAPHKHNQLRCLLTVSSIASQRNIRFTVKVDSVELPVFSRASMNKEIMMTKAFWRCKRPISLTRVLQQGGVNGTEITMTWHEHVVVDLSTLDTTQVFCYGENLILDHAEPCMYKTPEICN